MIVRRLIYVALVAFMAIAFATSARAQAPEGSEAKELETDRDSFTPATTTAACGNWIVESAWSFIDNRAVAETHSLPELVTRYGVADWLELRLGWNYEVGGGSSSVSGSTSVFETTGGIERESQLTYGVKAALTGQGSLLPRSAIIVQAGTPTQGPDPATQLVATYVFGWEYDNRWCWDSAIRYGFDSAEEDHFNLWAPSTVLKIPLGERWKAHAEYFGVFSQGRERERTQHYFSPGAHYLLTPDFEVGIRVGWGLNDQAAECFSNAGFGWRF